MRLMEILLESCKFVNDDRRDSYIFGVESLQNLFIGYECGLAYRSYVDAGYIGKI